MFMSSFSLTRHHALLFSFLIFTLIYLLNPLSVLFYFENVHLCALLFLSCDKYSAHLTRCTFLFISNKFFSLFIFLFMS